MPPPHGGFTPGRAEGRGQLAEVPRVHKGEREGKERHPPKSFFPPGPPLARWETGRDPPAALGRRGGETAGGRGAGGAGRGGRPGPAPQRHLAAGPGCPRAGPAGRAVSAYGGVCIYIHTSMYVHQRAVLQMTPLQACVRENCRKRRGITWVTCHAASSQVFVESLLILTHRDRPLSRSLPKMLPLATSEVK